MQPVSEARLVTPFYEREPFNKFDFYHSQWPPRCISLASEVQSNLTGSSQIWLTSGTSATATGTKVAPFEPQLSYTSIWENLKFKFQTIR
jgi:hypothetical protein